MTVGELIDKLKNYHDKTPVYTPALMCGYTDASICEQIIAENVNKDCDNHYTGPHVRDPNNGPLSLVIY